MATKSMNLIEAIQERCNELRDVYLPEYDKIPRGVFGATMIRQAIKRAESAIASDDVVACIQALNELRDFKL